MKTGEIVQISPELTGLADWKEGSVIQVENNKFNGIVISIKTTEGIIFFGQEKFFKPVQNK